MKRVYPDHKSLGAYDPRPENYDYYRVEGYFPYELIVRFILAAQQSGLSPDCRVLRLQISEGGHIYHFSRINEAYLMWQIKSKVPTAIHIGLLMPIGLNPAQFNHFRTPEEDDRALVMRRKFTHNGEASSPYQKNTQPKHEIHQLRDYLPTQRNFVMPLKELVFDIDIHDYDRFCNCHGGKSLCSICWLHLEGSYYILNFILTMLFGYAQANLLYVYSGKKGFHCFVNDSRAMALTASQRLFLCQTISIKSGGHPANEAPEDFRAELSTSVSYQADRHLMQWMKLYESERREASLDDTLDNLFTSMVLGGTRNLLKESAAFRDWIMRKARIHYPSCQERIRLQWQEALRDPQCTSVTLWQILVKYDAYGMLSVSKQPLVPFSQFIKYRLYYPMIDGGPLLMDHTIKLPFAIHPGTKNIALPVDESFFTTPKKEDAIVNLTKLYQHGPKMPPKAFVHGKHLLTRWLPQYTPLW